MRRVRACLVALVFLSACAPEACSDRDERRVQRWVELLTGEPGPTADAAERALIEHGVPAVQYLETGLYNAEPLARRRIVRTLVGIGDPAVLPILDHLARRDPDPDVRAAAAEGRAVIERGRSP